MKHLFRRLSFLWDEGRPPPEEGLRADSGPPSGVSRGLMRATRFAVIGALGTTLLAQVIGVRLVAPVDAIPAYPAICIRQCNLQHKECMNGCKTPGGGNTDPSCNRQCAAVHTSCIRACHNVSP